MVLTAIKFHLFAFSLKQNKNNLSLSSHLTFSRFQHLCKSQLSSKPEKTLKKIEGRPYKKCKWRKHQNSGQILAGPQSTAVSPVDVFQKQDLPVAAKSPSRSPFTIPTLVLLVSSTKNDAATLSHSQMTAPTVARLYHTEQKWGPDAWGAAEASWFV